MGGLFKPLVEGAQIECGTPGVGPAPWHLQDIDMSVHAGGQVNHACPVTKARQSVACISGN